MFHATRVHGRRVKPRADEWELGEYSTRDLVGHVGGGTESSGATAWSGDSGGKNEKSTTASLSTHPTRLQTLFRRLFALDLFHSPACSSSQLQCASPVGSPSSNPQPSHPGLQTILSHPPPRPQSPRISRPRSQLIPFFVIGVNSRQLPELSQVGRPGVHQPLHPR